jgi:hypothetical protein
MGSSRARRGRCRKRMGVGEGRRGEVRVEEELRLLVSAGVVVVSGKGSAVCCWGLI